MASAALPRLGLALPDGDAGVGVVVVAMVPRRACGRRARVEGCGVALARREMDEQGVYMYGAADTDTWMQDINEQRPPSPPRGRAANGPSLATF